MKEKIIIQICMGSSCFSRGNHKTLQVIQHYLKEHKLEGEVVLKGNHCFDDCSRGPILRINNTVYEHVDQENILELLEKIFSD